jgi:hypothetical protein
MTYREVFALLKGEATRRRRNRQADLWAHWHGAAFERQKRLPDLAAMLRQLEPRRVMSNREMRAQVMAMADALGAKVIRRKKNGA